MGPKDADGMVNSVVPDQTAPLAVWSGSTLFAQTCLSEISGSLRYYKIQKVKTRSAVGVEVTLKT